MNATRGPQTVKTGTSTIKPGPSTVPASIKGSQTVTFGMASAPIKQDAPFSLALVRGPQAVKIGMGNIKRARA